MMHPRSLLLVAVALAIVASPGPAGAQPAVHGVEPGNVELIPGGSPQGVSIGGRELHRFDSAEIVHAGSPVPHLHAELDAPPEPDPELRFVDLIAAPEAGPMSGAVLFLRSSTSGRSLEVPVRIDVRGGPGPAAPSGGEPEPAPPPGAPDREAPTAVLDAPPSVPTGEPIPLSGERSSDPGGGIARYEWTHVSGSGGSLSAGSAVETPDPAFAIQPLPPLAPGPHVFDLVVIDRAGNRSLPARVRVTVVADRQAPTAILDAPSSVPHGELVPLSGERSSDPGGGIARYEWTHVSGSGGSLSAGSAVETPDPALGIEPLPPLAPGPHVFDLVVIDRAGNRSLPARVRVEVSEP